MADPAKPNPNVYVSDSGIHGLGLFANRDIPEGELIGFYDGEETMDDGTHVLWVEQDDGSWLGYDGSNEMRYLNHARPANCEMDGQDCYAARDIKRHQELTIDYGEDFESTG
ncbi:MAG: SET domain-containing protein [Xanthomonadales bacterium]|nr:SET domain-containing protein [Gammaproteobacteria bacterium]NNE06268.1 SET domain-containing protein [Xanthomonadales bacterium]NNL94179.1 SET domain-containing protein [Xanthomonadales bacterium]